MEELIERLTHEAAQIEQAVKTYTRDRDKQQDLIDEAEGRLFSKQELITFLKASVEEMTRPKWKKGDRFRWKNYAYDEGEITDMYNDTVYIRTDAGGTMSISLKDFERRVELL